MNSLLSLDERIEAIDNLGREIESILNSGDWNDLLHEVYVHNNWFTKGNSKQSLKAITREFLDRIKLKNWVSGYRVESFPTMKTIGLVLAGNLPLVGFQDILCVLIIGHKALIKTSSKDDILTKAVMDLLVEIAPDFQPQFEFTERLQNFDAVIATGSSNSTRYFNYYFGKYPNIIRGSRRSVAILDGTETEADFLALGHDITDYFGLGCRNVSLIFIPKDFEMSKLIGSLESFSYISNHHKYNNNYEYFRSIYLINRDTHLDSGFLMFKKSDSLYPPISVVHYVRYDTLEEVSAFLQTHESEIQIVLSKDGNYKNSLAFGTSQHPSLSDYADGVDVMEFLCQL